MTLPELLLKAAPCPFCGNDRLTFETIMMDKHPRPISVACGDCDTWGPSAHNHLRAFQLWNGRTAAQSVGEGLALVPVEPTEAMSLAGDHASCDALACACDADSIYRAMIAAGKEGR